MRGAVDGWDFTQQLHAVLIKELAAAFFSKIEALIFFDGLVDFHEGIGAGKDDFVRDVFVGGLDVVLSHQLGFAGGEVHVDIAVAQDQGDGFQHVNCYVIACI